MLLRGPIAPTADDDAIADVIADSRFDATAQNAAVMLHRVFALRPAAVAAGLVRRLEAGIELPYRAEKMLTGISPVDDGPVAALGLNPSSPKKEGHIAATLAGPRTVARLLDAAVALAPRRNAASGAAEQSDYEQMKSVFGLNEERFWLGGAAHEGWRRFAALGRAGEPKTYWTKPPARCSIYGY